MKSRFEAVISTLLAISALTIAGSVAYRSFAPIRSDNLPPRPKPQHIRNWADVLPYGIRIGQSSAPVTLVEFSDLQCPICRGFHKTLSKFLADNSGRVSYVYVAFPLDMHKFAGDAARGAECAATSGRFGQWLDVVFDKQDSLGVKTWHSFAKDAGVSDTAAFVACIDSQDAFPRIANGKAIADQFGVTATPTIILNGWMLRGGVSRARLDSAVLDVLAGRKPFKDN